MAKGSPRCDVGERFAAVSPCVRCLLVRHSGAMGAEVAGTSSADNILSNLDKGGKKTDVKQKYKHVQYTDMF